MFCRQRGKYPDGGTPIGHKSVYVASKSDEYTIIVDTYGNCAGRRGNWRASSTLYCQWTGVRGISGNAAHIGYFVDCRRWNALTCRKLWSCFTNISALNAWRLSGRTYLRRFLEAGLIDEVSIMVARVLTGVRDRRRFSMEFRMECNPYKLKLEIVEQWETDIVWLRYKSKIIRLWSYKQSPYWRSWPLRECHGTRNDNNKI